MTQTLMCPNCGHAVRAPEKVKVDRDLPGFDSWWAYYRNGLASLYGRSMRDKTLCLELWVELGCEEQAEWLLEKLNLQVEYRWAMQGQSKHATPLRDPIRYLKNKDWREELPDEI